VAEIHGDQATQDESLLQFHTREELKAGLLDLYSADSIKKGITLLVAKGAITTHRNPNPRYKYDNTTYFLLHPDNLLIFLKTRKIVGPATENNSSKPGFPQLQAAQNRGTISETSTETTTESGGVRKNSLHTKIAEPQKQTHVLTAERGPTHTSSASLSQGNGNAHPNPTPTPTPSPPQDKDASPPWPSVEALVAMYNEQAPEEVPFVQHVSPGRRKLGTQALRAFADRAFWERVFRMMGKSPVLRGLRGRSGHEQWTADFDWLLARKDGVENYLKVHDGRYL
jgi:hypothetical protein